MNKKTILIILGACLIILALIIAFFPGNLIIYQSGKLESNYELIESENFRIKLSTDWENSLTKDSITSIYQDCTMEFSVLPVFETEQVEQNNYEKFNSFVSDNFFDESTINRSGLEITKKNNIDFKERTGLEFEANLTKESLKAKYFFVNNNETIFYSNLICDNTTFDSHIGNFDYSVSTLELIDN